MKMPNKHSAPQGRRPTLRMVDGGQPQDPTDMSRAGFLKRNPRIASQYETGSYTGQAPVSVPAPVAPVDDPQAKDTTLVGAATSTPEMEQAAKQAMERNLNGPHGFLTQAAYFAKMNNPSSAAAPQPTGSGIPSAAPHTSWLERQQSSPLRMADGGQPEPHPASILGIAKSLRSAWDSAGETAAAIQHRFNPAPTVIPPKAAPAPAPVQPDAVQQGVDALGGNKARVEAMKLKDGGQPTAPSAVDGGAEQFARGVAAANRIGQGRQQVSDLPFAVMDTTVGLARGAAGGLIDAGKKALRFEHGGSYHNGAGGKVPGPAEGDKFKALYEGGEFVASNDMLDAEPGLEQHLHDLRNNVLMAQGKDPAAVGAKQAGSKGLRALNGAEWDAITSQQLAKGAETVGDLTAPGAPREARAAAAEVRGQMHQPVGEINRYASAQPVQPVQPRPTLAAGAPQTSQAAIDAANAAADAERVAKAAKTATAAADAGAQAAEAAPKAGMLRSGATKVANAVSGAGRIGVNGAKTLATVANVAAKPLLGVQLAAHTDDAAAPTLTTLQSQNLRRPFDPNMTSAAPARQDVTGPTFERLGMHVNTAPGGAASFSKDAGGFGTFSGRGSADDPRRFDLDPSRQSLGSARDFSKELNKVPDGLPADLRDGVVYKTVDPKTGRVTYSGRNVGVNSKGTTEMVDGMGRSLKMLDGNQSGKGTGFVQSIDKDGKPTGPAVHAFGGGVNVDSSSGFMPQGGDRTPSLLRGAADRGDWDAVRGYYASQGQSFGGMTPQQIQSQQTAATAAPRLQPGDLGYHAQLRDRQMAEDRQVTREGNQMNFEAHMAPARLAEANRRLIASVLQHQSVGGDPAKAAAALVQAGRPDLAKTLQEAVSTTQAQASNTDALVKNKWEDMRAQFKTNRAADGSPEGERMNKDLEERAYARLKRTHPTAYDLSPEKRAKVIQQTIAEEELMQAFGQMNPGGLTWTESLGGNRQPDRTNELPGRDFFKGTSLSDRVGAIKGILPNQSSGHYILRTPAGTKDVNMGNLSADALARLNELIAEANAPKK